MTEERIFEMLTASRAKLSGHFLLTSGLHSDTYLQCARLTQFPDFGGEIGQALAEKFSGSHVDLVVGPAMGGIILAYEVARGLKVPALFTERQEGRMTLRRGFEIHAGQRVLVTEDVVTTGGSVKEVIRLLEDIGAVVAGVGAVIDRSGGKVDFGYPFHALLTLNVKTYDPSECPLCQQGLPAVKPGSRQVSL